MANKGLQFEWCIYHLIAKANPTKYKSDADAKKAATNYAAADKDVKESAANAISMITKKYGTITKVEKKSGGGVEPKTDLLITTNRIRLKCSLKYGGSVQLSSGGIKNTTRFLSGVIGELGKTNYMSPKKSKELIAFLSDMETNIGGLGSLKAPQAKKILEESADYQTKLQEILGSKKTPDVTKEYQKLKLAIVKEAMTGNITFKANKDLAADHILSESYIRKIDNKFISEVAAKTTVRLALKGRGKTMMGGKEIRLNEIVVRFDTAS